jgi:hypothetical protein
VGKNIAIRKFHYKNKRRKLMLYKGKKGKKKLTERMHLVSNLLGSADRVNMDGVSEPKEAVKVDDEDEMH